MIHKVKQHLLSSHYQAKTIDELATFFDVSMGEMQNIITVLVDEGIVMMSRKQKVITPEMANLIVGTILIHPKGYGFLQSDQLQEDLFVPAPYLNSALNKDTVIASVKREKNEAIGQIVKIIKRYRTQLVGRVKSKNKKLYLESLDQSISQWIPLKSKKGERIKIGHMVVAEIESYQPLVGRYSHSLGHANDAQVDIKALLSEYEIPLEFPKTVIEQAQRVSLYKDKDERVDLTHMQAFTIDNEDAKDFDDAITISKLDDGYELGVHIADVSFYVQENSVIDQEARERGTSIYATDYVVPMLPEILSNNVCSLQPHVPRYTLSCIMRIDETGQVTSSKLLSSIIQSKKRFTYAQVNDIITGKNLDDHHEFIESIQIAHACAQKLHAYRNQQGNLDFVNPEPYFIMDQGKVLDILVRHQNQAEALIESFMVAANEAVAQTLKTMEIPAIYRVHENPDAEKIRQLAHFLGLLDYKFKGNPNNIHQSQLKQVLTAFAGTDLETIVNQLTLRSMKKATYESVPLGHFGLALDDYLHFTAPIRRYSDLIVHRMIRRYLFDHELSKRQINLDQQHNTEFASVATFTERRAIDAERAVADMKKAEYMEAFIGEYFEGTISGVISFGFFVQLENTVEGLVHVHSLDDDYYSIDHPYPRLVGFHNHRKFSLGDKVLVKVKDASKTKRQIDFTYIKHVKDEIIKYNNK